MRGRFVRLPGYEFVSRRWLHAKSGSRAEATWYWLRLHLRFGIGKCLFTSNGGMHCAKDYAHDGPHSFTNAEWNRTRPASSTGSDQP